MSDVMPCVNCDRFGFVRKERTISGGVDATRYHCGSCECYWIIRDVGERRTRPRLERHPGQSIESGTVSE